jgi:hypothetical protein
MEEINLERTNHALEGINLEGINDAMEEIIL